jgi:predicted metal-dependent hydrolase
VKALIVAFVADLMFQTRLETTAEKLDYQVLWVESAGQLKAPEDIRDALELDGILIDQLTRLGPRLLIFDLGNEAIPWRQWIPIVKGIPATWRIPVICFGSHVDVDTLRAARQTGADEVVARSRFVTALPQLIEKHTRSIDPIILVETCAQSLHPDAVKGLMLFNQGDYFAAHEWLEEAWKDDLSPGRDLYRAVLQVAVAYFHVIKGNYRGAIKMFQRARHWIDRLPDRCRGVNVAKLRQDAYKIHDQVLALGSERIIDFDKGLLKPVQWRNPDAKV